MHLVGKWRPGVDIVEFLGKNWHKQDDDAEERGKPEVGGVHTVERHTLVVVTEERRMCHQGHDEERSDRAPDEQMVDTSPEVRLQTTLHRSTQTTSLSSCQTHLANTDTLNGILSIYTVSQKNMWLHFLQ